MKKSIIDVKDPGYIQLGIRRMIYHSGVVKHNTALVNNWMIKNNINRSISLTDLLDDKKNKKIKAKKVPFCQLTIFDLLKGE